MNNRSLIRRIYLYLVAMIGIIIFVIGTISLLDLGLRSFVFTQADLDYYAQPLTPEGKPAVDEAAYQKQMTQNRLAQKQRQASTALAMMVVGYPLYAFHWRMIKKDK